MHCLIILSVGRSQIVLFPLLHMARADLLVSRQGTPEPPRAPAVLLAASDHLRARPRSRMAALLPQWALAGALPAHAARWPRPSGVSDFYSVNFILKTFFFFNFCLPLQVSPLNIIAYILLIRSSCFLSSVGPIMKTGLLFSMKREPVCCPPWLLVRAGLSSMEFSWIKINLHSECKFLVNSINNNNC